MYLSWFTCMCCSSALWLSYLTLFWFMSFSSSLVMVMNYFQPLLSLSIVACAIGIIGVNQAFYFQRSLCALLCSSKKHQMVKMKLSSKCSYWITAIYHLCSTHFAGWNMALCFDSILILSSVTRWFAGWFMRAFMTSVPSSYLERFLKCSDWPYLVE